MKLVTADEMRELDRRTIEEFGIPGELLMDRAGEGVATVVRRLTEAAGFVNPGVLLLAGRGNNGGDAFTAAYHLKRVGVDVEVWLAGTENQVKGDALKHLGRMKSAGVSFRELPTKEDWDDELAVPVLAEIIVDGLLGIGSQGPARGPVVGAIEFINANANDAVVVAIDIPSGLNADTGEPMGDAIRADITVTMALPKKGLARDVALEHVGSIEVVDIGVPREYVDELDSPVEAEFVYVPDLKPFFTRRPRAAHKGHYGHVLLVGGAKGYAGAITLSARSALRSGTGLVTVLTPESVAPIVASNALEAMVHGVQETGAGSLSSELLDNWEERLNEFDAVLVGPGLTRDEAAHDLVQKILACCRVPMVLDADAISVLAGEGDQLKKAECPIVITPHPGELSKLMGLSISDIQQNRRQSARQAARATGATVVLKGAGTIIAQEERPYRINLTGNPGMATGGSGDVLAGLITGLLGQRMDPFDAACVAVHLHGRAGDMASWRKSQAGMVAGDLIDELPYVFRELSLR